jgi:aryl-alcohol dehydrogenase-like predicted oxidoreductase
MRYRPLGKTGQFVSEICLGTMTFSGGQGFWRTVGTVDQEGATALVARALEAGVNFFDTANVYSEGQSEVLLGRALRDLDVPRENVIIATKVFGRTGPGPNSAGLSRGHIMDQVEASLKRLGVEHLDLYQIHGFDSVTPVEVTLRALDDCVSQGMIRTLGCSNLAAWQIMKALGVSEQRGFARFETVQAYYTLASRDLEREILPLCDDQGLGVMVWSPLAGGLLSGKFTRSTQSPEGARRSAFDFPPVDRERVYDLVDVMPPHCPGTRRFDFSDRARLVIAPQRRDECHRRRQDTGAIGRQPSCQPSAFDRQGYRHAGRSQPATPRVPWLDARAPGG